MYELTSEQEAILAECLKAMEEGQGLEACLARFPQDAHALRPYLHMHEELLGTEVPEPTAAMYQSGREALLLAVAGGGASSASTMLVGSGAGAGLASLVAAVQRWFAGGVRIAGRPAVPGLAAVALVVLLGGGALGASAAAGFGPAQAVLSSLGMMDPPGDDGSKLVEDDGDKDEEPAETETEEPKKTPASVVAPKATPTADKPGEAVPTDKPQPTVAPTKQPDHPKPSPTRAPVPTEQPDPEPIPVDLGDICIPINVYQQTPGLHAYAVKICNGEEVAYLKDTFAKGLCLPKETADAYLSLLDLGISPCLPKQEEHFEQFLFVEGWCAPDKAAELLADVGSTIPACTAHKIKVTLLWLKDNDPCRINWQVPPPSLSCS
jgi:hypothetical protein